MEKSKPDFSWWHGLWIDPEYLPAKLRRELDLHLVNSGLTDEQKGALLKYASDIAQMAVDGELVAADAQRQEIQKVAANSRRLLASMAALKEPTRDALHAHITAFVGLGLAAPDIAETILASKAREGLFSETWDAVSALEQAADYAAGEYALSTTCKPAQARARGLVSQIASRVFEMTGQTPPKDAAAWFAGFVTCLGQHLGLPIGPRVVASGIKAIR